MVHVPQAPCLSSRRRGADTGDPSEIVQGEGVACCLRPGDTAPERTLTCVLDIIRGRIETVHKLVM